MQQTAAAVSENNNKPGGKDAVGDDDEAVICKSSSSNSLMAYKFNLVGQHSNANEEDESQRLLKGGTGGSGSQNTAD